MAGPRWRRTLTTATGALLALTVGIGFASAGAVPGGLLYPVKQLIQSAQLQLAHGDLSRGQTLLDQAEGTSMTRRPWCPAATPTRATSTPH